MQAVIMAALALAGVIYAVVLLAAGRLLRRLLRAAGRALWGDPDHYFKEV